MTTYCLGFLFTKYFEYVAVINKQKPAWQKGLWNGIGGKVESGEDGPTAMCREFHEETGVKTTLATWLHFATMQGPTWVVWCYTAVLDHCMPVDLKKLTEEQPDWLKVSALRKVSTIPNVKWLVPAAIDRLANEESFILTAAYD